jgi:hypothetical protein
MIYDNKVKLVLRPSGIYHAPEGCIPLDRGAVDHPLDTLPRARGTMDGLPVVKTLR